MTVFKITRAKDAQNLAAEARVAALQPFMRGAARMKVIEKAIVFAAKDKGKNNTFVYFRATNDEIVELMDLGYDVHVSDSGTTQISWFK